LKLLVNIAQMFSNIHIYISIGVQKTVTTIPKTSEQFSTINVSV